VEKWPKQCMHMWINEQKKFKKIKCYLQGHFNLGQLVPGTVLVNTF
jgi:hypothetical protein